MREYIWTPAPAASRNSDPKRNRRAWSPDWWCPNTIEPPAPRPPTIMSAALHRCAFCVMTSTRPFRGSPAAQAEAPKPRTNPAARRAVARGRSVGAQRLPGDGRALDPHGEAFGASMPHLQAPFFSKRDAPLRPDPKTQPRQQLDLRGRPLRRFRRAPPTPPPPLLAVRCRSLGPTTASQYVRHSARGPAATGAWDWYPGVRPSSDAPESLGRDREVAGQEASK